MITRHMMQTEMNYKGEQRAMKKPIDAYPVQDENGDYIVVLVYAGHMDIYPHTYTEEQANRIIDELKGE